MVSTAKVHQRGRDSAPQKRARGEGEGNAGPPGGRTRGLGAWPGRPPGGQHPPRPLESELPEPT